MTWAAIAVGGGSALLGGAMSMFGGGDNEPSGADKAPYYQQMIQWQKRLERYLQMVQPARREYRRALAGEWDVGTQAKMQQRLEGITDQSTQARMQLLSAVAGRGTGGGPVVAGLRGIGEQATLAGAGAWRDIEQERRAGALGGIERIAGNTAELGAPYPGSSYPTSQPQQQPNMDLSGLGMALAYGMNQGSAAPQTTAPQSQYYAPLWEILNKTR